MIEVNNHTHGYRIATKAGCQYHSESDQVISRVEGGELWGGVIYTGYTKTSIAMHVASFHPYWLNRRVLGLLFDYPFNRLNCEKVICFVRGGNKAALDFVLKVGYQVAARVRGVYPGRGFDGDMVILDMSKSSCRWLKWAPKNLEGGTDGLV